MDGVFWREPETVEVSRVVHVLRVVHTWHAIVFSEIISSSFIFFIL